MFVKIAWATIQSHIVTVARIQTAFQSIDAYDYFEGNLAENFSQISFQLQFISEGFLYQIPAKIGTFLAKSGPFKLEK